MFLNTMDREIGCETNDHCSHDLLLSIFRNMPGLADAARYKKLRDKSTRLAMQIYLVAASSCSASNALFPLRRNSTSACAPSDPRSLAATVRNAP